MDSVLRDLAYAVRTLRKKPAFTITALVRPHARHDEYARRRHADRSRHVRNDRSVLPAHRRRRMLAACAHAPPHSIPMLR